MGGLLDQQRKEQAEAKQEFPELAIREGINWHKKSRINWLRNGDNNTKLSHSYANQQKNQKSNILHGY